MKSYTRLVASVLVVIAVSVGASAPVVAHADLWYDGGYDEGSWYDGGYDSGSWYDGGYDEGAWYDGGYSGDQWYDAGSGTDWYDAGSADWYDAGTSDWYDAGYSTYYDESCNCYSYGSGGTGARSGSYGSSGYSTVRPMTINTPNYPVYNPPTKSTGGSSSSISNVTNTSVTNIDNSIRDSFNNYNSNNVSYVAPATPQYPVVHTNPAPYCQIYQASSASGYGVNAVYLSWSSSNATSAYLSGVGGVAVTGSKTVWPSAGTTYTLTVYGYNGQTAQCQTTVNAYSATPYVSLSQIPYTGFDFGTFGNAMYWAGLAVFALGAGYLAIYYIPALAFAGVRSRKQFAPVVAPKAPILVEREAAVAPIVSSIRKAGTTDTMAIFASKDGSMPKIVIDRS